MLKNANPHLSVLGGEGSTWASRVSGKLPRLSCLSSGDAIVGVALIEWQTGEMARWVKALVIKPDDLSSISRTQTLEEN